MRTLYPRIGQRELRHALVFWTLFSLWLIVFILIQFSGCAHVRPGPGPQRQATPFEQVLASNAILANANLAIAQGVIAGAEANEIPVPLANQILTAQSKIADADRQLTLILQKGQGALSGDAGQIQSLLNQIKASAQELVASGTAGVKNPSRATLITNNIAAVLSQAAQIVSLLQSLGVLK